jgi:hypothetical protein
VRWPGSVVIVEIIFDIVGTVIDIVGIFPRHRRDFSPSSSGIVGMTMAARKPPFPCGRGPDERPREAPQ